MLKLKPIINKITDSYFKYYKDYNNSKYCIDCHDKEPISEIKSFFVWEDHKEGDI